jgi:hypothetical protein
VFGRPSVRMKEIGSDCTDLYWGVLLTSVGIIQFRSKSCRINGHLAEYPDAFLKVPVGDESIQRLFLLICVVGGGIKFHSTLRPLNGLLCQPRVIMIMEKSVE